MTGLQVIPMIDKLKEEFGEWFKLNLIYCRFCCCRFLFFCFLFLRWGLTFTW